MSICCVLAQSEYTYGLGGLSLVGAAGSMFTKAVTKHLAEPEHDDHEDGAGGGIVTGQVRAMEELSATVVSELGALSHRLSASTAREDALRRQVAELRGMMGGKAGDGGVHVAERDGASAPDVADAAVFVHSASARDDVVMEDIEGVAVKE